VGQIQDAETGWIEFSAKGSKERGFSCARLTQEQGIGGSLVEGSMKGCQGEMEVSVPEGIFAEVLRAGRMHHVSFVLDGREICPSRSLRIWAKGRPVPRRRRLLAKAAWKAVGSKGPERDSQWRIRVASASVEGMDLAMACERAS